jgi:hypothetical protein
MFMKLSLILLDQLQFIVKICGLEREEKCSLEHHINRKSVINVYQNSEI